MFRARCSLLLLLAACATDDGSEPVEATHDLLFEGTEGAVAELWLRNTDDASLDRILPTGTLAMNPAASPDGSRIAFVVADYDAGSGDIYAVDPNGANLLQLTDDEELDDEPSWSPDGRSIVFRSFRLLREGDLWVMDADGGNPIQLTFDPLPGVTDERRPAWSPDGLRIAYASNAGGNIDIWTMAADGSDPQRLTDSTDLDTEPAWSPDGLWIAFRRSSSSSGSDLFVIAATGGTPQPLALAGEQRMPQWTPDGERLLYVQQASLSARPDLYVVRRDGSGATPLVTTELSGGSRSPVFLKRR